MSKVEVSESDQLNLRKDSTDNEIGETYEDKGYSKIPLDQINLNTEPISITSGYNRTFIDNNIKSYIKVFLCFVVFAILIFTISILYGHFHYEKVEVNEKDGLKDKHLNKNLNIKNENNKTLSQTPIQSEKNQTINETINKNVTDDKKFR